MNTILVVDQQLSPLAASGRVIWYKNELFNIKTMHSRSSNQPIYYPIALANPQQVRIKTNLYFLTSIRPKAKWKSNGVTIAGGHGRDSQQNQLYNPYNIAVDSHSNLY
ncbi:unnamed protein product, partial [Didymodactylos carnosus]